MRLIVIGGRISYTFFVVFAVSNFCALAAADTACSVDAEFDVDTTCSEATTATTMALHDPATREARYSSNLAQYLVELHDNRAVFDFCGGPSRFRRFSLECISQLRS